MYTIKKQIKVMVMAALCFACMLLCTATVRAASADNSLSSLKLSEGTLSPSFQYNVVNYTASVGSETASIEVQAKPSNGNASVQSGTGTYDLKEGENTIRVVVAAENGNLATYTVKVTRGGSTAAASSDTDGNQTAEDGQDETADTPEDSQDVPEDGSDGAQNVVTGAEGYTPADTIPESVIPAEFTQTTVSYQDAEYPALRFDKGDVTLLYMVNAENEGMLFLYDTTAGAVYPFIRLSAQDKYLILLPAPAEAALGENYTQVTLTIDNKSVPAAYQKTGSAAAEFYQIYGINSDGTAGWYQYDSVEGTYQRYQETEVTETEVTASDEYQFLQNAYNDLREKYSTLKSRDTRYMAGMIIAIAVLLIIIVNLLLLRKEKSEGSGKAASKEIFEEDTPEKENKVKKQKKKERRAGAKELLADSGFYEKDEDSFEDFEEEPDFLSGKRKKKEKKEKKEKKRFKKREDIFDDGDEEEYFDEEAPLIGTGVEETSALGDDLEILDLNDL